MSLIWAQISYFWLQIVTNTILEMNESIIFKLVYNYMHIQATFLNKKFERLRAFLDVFLAKFFQKTNFFQKFLHFWNRLDELVGKMVLFFHFDELHILAFLALDCLKYNFKMKIYAQDTRNKLKMNQDYE